MVDLSRTFTVFFSIFSIYLYWAALNEARAKQAAELFGYSAPEQHLMRTAAVFLALCAFINIYAFYEEKVRALRACTNAFVVFYYFTEVLYFRAMQPWVVLLPMAMVYEIYNDRKFVNLQASLHQHAD
jgi:hypothetical protein